MSEDISKRPRLGIVLTIIYLAVVGLIVAVNWQSFARLEPNAWGDFLAGSLGLLALFWLILGYFQQGDELRNSVRALEQQSKELATTAEQQRELVRSSERTAELDTERFLGSLELEAVKLQNRSQLLLANLPGLFQRYTALRQFEIASSQGTNSGAMQELDRETDEFCKKLARLNESVETMSDIIIPEKQNELIAIIRVLHRLDLEIAQTTSSIDNRVEEVMDRNKTRSLSRRS